MDSGQQMESDGGRKVFMELGMQVREENDCSAMAGWMKGWGGREQSSQSGRHWAQSTCPCPGLHPD